jgi:hypothetical protein
MVWQAAPLAPLAAALASGIWARAWIAPPTGWLLTAGAVLLITGTTALVWRRERVAAVALIGLTAVLGMLRGATPPLPPDHIARVALGPSATVEGRLAEEPTRWAPDRTRLVLEVDGLVHGEDRRPATGRIQFTLYGEPPTVGEGQRIAAELKLHRPLGFRNPGGFDYPALLRREGILLVGSGRAAALMPLTPDEPPWPVRVKRWAVATIAAHLPEASAALLSGLILGEKTGMPPEGSGPP